MTMTTKPHTAAPRGRDGDGRNNHTHKQNRTERNRTEQRVGRGSAHMRRRRRRTTTTTNQPHNPPTHKPHTKTRHETKHARERARGDERLVRQLLLRGVEDELLAPDRAIGHGPPLARRDARAHDVELLGGEELLRCVDVDPCSGPWQWFHGCSPCQCCAPAMRVGLADVMMVRTDLLAELEDEALVQVREVPDLRGGTTSFSRSEDRLSTTTRNGRLRRVYGSGTRPS